jgi:hypothetical protein
MEYWCKDSLKSIQTFKKNWDYKSVTDEWTEGQRDGRTHRLLYIAIEKQRLDVEKKWLVIEEQKHQLYMTKLNFDLSQKGIYVGLNN